MPPPSHNAFGAIPAELEQLERADAVELGDLSEFFARAAQQPEALASFWASAEALRNAVPARLAQTIALTIGAHTGNHYELAHSRASAIAQGMTCEEVHALERMRAGTCLSFSDEEVAVAALARCLLEDSGCGCESALLRLSRLIGEAATTACLMLAAHHLASALLANAWNLRPPVGGDGAPDGGNGAGP